MLCILPHVYWHEEDGGEDDEKDKASEAWNGGNARQARQAPSPHSTRHPRVISHTRPIDIALEMASQLAEYVNRRLGAFD
jgi:hypothetical protein